jgi:hypothetical protein
MPPELDRPFDSVLGVLGRSGRLFASRLGFFAALTLVVFVPGKLLIQLACALFDIAPDGVASYLLMDAGTLVLSAWTIPAAICAVTRNAGLGDSLAYGRRLWGRMLWNKFKVEITITLYSLLLFIPGLIAMAKLALVDAIVALEGAREPEPLARSRELTAGIRWKVFFVLAPLSVVDLAGSFYLLSAIPGASHSRPLIALIDSVWAIFSVWGTLAGLIMYEGRVGPKTNPPQKHHPQKHHRR